jgi:hypothetical protein
MIGSKRVETQRRGGRREFIHALSLRSLRLCVSKPVSESVGLLINFHEVKLVDVLHRIVNNFKEAS